MPVAALQGDEVLVGRLGEAHAPACGQRVVVRYHEAQPLLVQAPGDEIGRVGHG